MITLYIVMHMLQCLKPQLKQNGTQQEHKSIQNQQTSFIAIPLMNIMTTV